MPEKYEGETCEGCVYSVIPHGDVQPCEDCVDMSHFKRSLECRKVRALEALQTSIDFAAHHGWGHE